MGKMRARIITRSIEVKEGAMDRSTTTCSLKSGILRICLFTGFMCLLILLLFSGSQALAAVWYVTPTGAGSQNGTTWSAAFSSIQTAINAATTNDEIWVKEGTYAITPGTDENPSEILVDQDVAIYGGFAGGETLLEQRDWRTHKTTVSGINYNTRILHLIANATIDGFTITGGRLNSSTPNPAVGGGILIESNNALVRNCVITDNRASISGGGIALLGTENSSSIINTYIYNNHSMFSHGGLDISSPGSPKIVNCVIANNGGENGGGIRSSSLSSPIIANCTIFGNTSEPGSPGTGVRCGGAATITNCIIWGNQDYDGTLEQMTVGAGSTISYCNIEQSGFEGTIGYIGSNPLFVDPDGFDDLPGTADDDFRLQMDSDCIDTGSSTAVPPGITTDLDGNPRISGAAVDIGAYEYQLQVTYCSDVDGDGYVVSDGVCTIPAGKQAGDCNDSNAAIHPGATEVPNNGVDENCDGVDVDTIGPSIQMTLPADGATNVAVNTNIVVHVTDGSSGVVRTSIVMKVKGVVVTPVISPTSSTSSDYTLTYDPPTDFANGLVVNVVVTASDGAGNSQTKSFSFIVVSQLNPGGDDDQDGIPNGVEATLGTNPNKKTLFVRPYKKTSTGLAYWSDFNTVLFPPASPRPGFAEIPSFSNLGIEISVIGDPNHPYAQMSNINYDPATDNSHPACDILELIYNAMNSDAVAELPTDQANRGHTYFTGQTWTWDTKGKTPNISSSAYYLKYKYHKPYAYAWPLDRYIAEGAYPKVGLNESYIGTSNCGHSYCYDYSHCSPMNLNDGESVPPYTGLPDETVEMTNIVYDSSGKITAIDPRGESYDRDAVLKRTIVHEMGHAILGASSGDHCNEPQCILYHSTVGGWELLNFGGPACTHGQSIPGGIHNAVHQ
jgi:hypothetical protein